MRGQRAYFVLVCLTCARAQGHRTRQPPSGWFHDLWTSQGILDGEDAKDGHARGVWPANVSFAQLIDNAVPVASRNAFVVNLGANDGQRHDPAFPLIAERGYGGILVEGDPAFKKRLYANVAPFNTTGKLHISWGFASATSIGRRLLSLGCPRAPDALKIDVDGLDAALLEGVLLSGILPKTVAIEVNPDIPPPLQLDQLYHDGFQFDFLYKHLRGWLGASADGLYALMSSHGYAFAAFELGVREHTVCTTRGNRPSICKKKGTCTHCEQNMWFVRSELLKAMDIEPPSWHQMVAAFWKQTFAFNTYKGNTVPFPNQRVHHDGWYARTAEDSPWTPECYTLSDFQYTKPRSGERFTKPACPLQAIRSQFAAGVIADGEQIGWRGYVKLSHWLSKPANAHRGAEFAQALAKSIRLTACREDELCPCNATSSVHRRSALPMPSDKEM